MGTPQLNSTTMKPCYVVLEPMTPKVNLNFSAELKKVINERNILTTKTRRRVTEALDEIECETREDTRKSRKQRVLAELLETEEKYVSRLEIIMEFFLKPAQERKLLRPQDFDVLFGNIKTIYNVNKELLEELRRTPNSVTSAFSKIAPFLKLYSCYAWEFKKSLQILQNSHRDNLKFAKFLEMQESRPEVQSKLSALLITPIQRVPRYKLLLKILFRLTSPREDDYSSLLDSLNKVEEAADHINKIIKDQENMQRLIELQRCIQNGEPNVITPGRTLRKEGTLMKIAAKDGHSQRIHVVLMNDIVMFCKLKKDEVKVNSLKCSLIFPLNKCKVVELLDKGSFRIICEGEEIVLYHERLSETVEWIKDLKDAIQTHLEDRKTLRKESSARRPVKRKDLGEYNEVGVSPGKRLKKKRGPYDEEVDRPFAVAKRRPIRPDSRLSGAASDAKCEERLSPLFITLKPKEEERESESGSEGRRSDDVNGVGRDLFVFGGPNPDRGFSFKMNRWFCGIGSSVKKFFGFK